VPIIKKRRAVGEEESGVAAAAVVLEMSACKEQAVVGEHVCRLHLRADEACSGRQRPSEAVRGLLCVEVFCQAVERIGRAVAVDMAPRERRPMVVAEDSEPLETSEPREETLPTMSREKRGVDPVGPNEDCVREAPSVPPLPPEQRLLSPTSSGMASPPLPTSAAVPAAAE